MIKFLLIIIVFVNQFFSISPLQNQLEIPKSIELPLETLKENLEKFGAHKEIPDEIREITLLALSHYPELLDVKIDFQFQNKIRGSVMQAQPKIGSLFFDSKGNRSYRIKISRHLELLDEMLPIEELPADVLLGWIGHELGHIKDYVDRSALNLMSFGVRYALSNNFVTQAEITADSHSVSNGLGKAIIATKDFVLNHNRLPEGYKNKIRALYMSPGEILSLVDVEEDK